MFQSIGCWENNGFCWFSICSNMDFLVFFFPYLFGCWENQYQANFFFFFGPQNGPWSTMAQRGPRSPWGLAGWVWAPQKNPFTNRARFESLVQARWSGPGMKNLAWTRPVAIPKHRLHVKQRQSLWIEKGVNTRLSCYTK